MKSAFYVFRKGTQIVQLYVGEMEPEWVRDIERLAKVKMFARTKKGFYFA